MTKVINFFAEPSGGKSTTAASLFVLMKRANYKVELISERAKELVYEDRTHQLTDQLSLLAEQNKRVARLIGKVDWVITDSPLLLTKVYAPANYFNGFGRLVYGVYGSYDNIHVTVNRTVRPYQPYGRTQTEEQAAELKVKINKELQNYLEWRSAMNYNPGPHYMIDANPRCEEVLADYLGLIWREPTQ